MNRGAVSGRIPKGAFAHWAMNLLSVTASYVTAAGDSEEGEC